MGDKGQKDKDKKSKQKQSKQEQNQKKAWELRTGTGMYRILGE